MMMQLLNQLSWEASPKADIRGLQHVVGPIVHLYESLSASQDPHTRCLATSKLLHSCALVRYYSPDLFSRLLKRDVPVADISKDTWN